MEIANFLTSYRPQDFQNLPWSQSRAPSLSQPHLILESCASPFSVPVLSLPCHTTVTKWLKPYSLNILCGPKASVLAIWQTTTSSESQGSTGSKFSLQLEKESMIHFFSNIILANSTTSFKSNQILPSQWGTLWLVYWVF